MLLKKILGLPVAIHNHLIAVKSVYVSNEAASAKSTSYVEMLLPGGYLQRYKLEVTMFDGVTFGASKHYRKVWKSVIKLSKGLLPGSVHIVHINGKNFAYEG